MLELEPDEKRASDLENEFEEGKEEEERDFEESILE